MNLTSNTLSPRELEIYKYLLKGLDYYRIADELSIKRNTVVTHVLSLFNKLLVSSRLELMAQRIEELEQEVEELKGTNCNTRVN